MTPWSINYYKNVNYLKTYTALAHTHNVVFIMQRTFIKFIINFFLLIFL